MANIILFGILAIIIIASAIISITTKKIMRAATFLLFVLLGISGLYFILDYTFLAAAQIAIYAGGITMVYIFAIQLVSVRNLQGNQEKINSKKMLLSILMALICFVVVVGIFLKNAWLNRSLTIADIEVPVQNIGNLMLSSDKYGYVLPFELISVFLLACIIGGIMIARKGEEK